MQEILGISRYNEDNLKGIIWYKWICPRGRMCCVLPSSSTSDFNDTTKHFTGSVMILDRFVVYKLRSIPCMNLFLTLTLCHEVPASSVAWTMTGSLKRGPGPSGSFWHGEMPICRWFLPFQHHSMATDATGSYRLPEGTIRTIIRCRRRYFMILR